MKKTPILFLLLVIAVQNSRCQSAIFSSEAVHHPIMSTNGMVATQHGEATKVGLEILKAGGNAVDAAVGVGFALAVVLPRAGNLGGGGFMLIHDSAVDTTYAINYREMAPSASHRDMYLNEHGDVDSERFNQSYLSIGVPGTVSGLCYALENYGTMELSDVLAPVIKLAEEGFPITYDLSRLLEKYEDRLKKCTETEAIFYPSDTTYYSAGDTLVQKDLAWSLQQISNFGVESFYQGAIAERLIQGIQENGGIMTLRDLDNYEPHVYEPVVGTYNGYEIVTMPPPSSGGIHLIQMLNILENYPLDSLGHNSAQSIHYLVEAMRLAYADRSEHLGDPLFWDVPVEGITSKEYADTLLQKIKPDKANLSSEINPGTPQDFESEETTHFSIVDKDGNVVSNTYTLNFSFGTGLIAKGTGFILNNEMGDFSAKPGSPNAYGLLGGEANAVEPGKRPLSSMTPTMVFRNGEPYLCTGTPGGSRIITTVLQVIVNILEYDMNVAEATNATRIHHQWYPDVLYHENILNYDTRAILRAMGHQLEVRSAMGSTQSILMDDGLYQGSSDTRRPDARTMGY